MEYIIFSFIFVKYDTQKTREINKKIMLTIKLILHYQVR